MKHRHLITEDYSLASIDDIISRGLWADWLELGEQIQINPSVVDKIKHVCRHYIDDPYEQRYHFWFNYVQKKRQTG